MAQRSSYITWSLLAAASLVLAVRPALWLWGSWTGDWHDSQGHLYFLAVLILALRSGLSGTAPLGSGWVCVGLLAGAAGLRLASQLLAVNLIGGAALALDVFALARLFGLERRPVPLSPLWLAVLFLFCLPLEPVVERVLGFPLQMISARVACAGLGLVVSDVVCAGIRITIAGQDVLVDLPCAGAAGLLVLLALWAGLNTVQRPRLRAAALWGLAMLTCAVAGNALRIAALAAGLVAGLDVMAEPWHSAIGLVTLGLAAGPLLLRPARPVPVATRRVRVLRVAPGLQMAWSALALCLAGGITLLQGRPVDVSAPVAPVHLPAMLVGHGAQPVGLTPQEAQYFQAYGGQAAKAIYGPLGVNVISTTSPLRHLHGAETCLRGLGFKVTFEGTRHVGVPASIYRATAPDGRRWRVTVTYASDRGQAVASISETVWLWLRGARGPWRSVQLLTPEGLGPSDRAALEAAALAAFDISDEEEGPIS